jgi:hypothetical protein
METHVDEIRSAGTLPPAEAFRTYEPSQRVQARIEVTGPGRLRRPTAGVDVKGDGSVVPYRGEVFKKPLDPDPGELPSDAVRKALAG